MIPALPTSASRRLAARGWLSIAGTSLIAFLVCTGCMQRTPVVEVTAGPDRSTELTPFAPAAEDWPQWRGPHGNGIAISPRAPTRWSENEGIRWQAPVPGRGHGSPVVCGDLVLLATALKEEQQQLVVAFDRETGAERWQSVVHEGGFASERRIHAKGTHANSTVACDDKRVFIAFLHNDQIHASALDFDGNLLWQQELGAFNSKFGYAPSPLVYQDLVIIAADNQGGGYLTALDRQKGGIVWRKARSNSSTYSSPVVAHVAGQDQLLISGGYEVASYDPLTGERLWACSGTTDATCGTIVWHDDLVFASGGYPDRQTLAVRADGSGEIVWENSVKNYEPSMIVAEDHLYAVTDNGIAYCFDCLSGEKRWQKRLPGNFSASPTLCGDKLYATNDRGKTFVFQANAEQFTLVAENQLGDDTYASPAICDEEIFLRVGKGQGSQRAEFLFCLGVPTMSDTTDE